MKVQNRQEDEVYLFCVDNDIEVDWDYNNQFVWNDIYFDREIVLQVDQGTSVEDFLKLIESLTINFKSEDFPFLPKGFLFTCDDEDLFKRFYEQYKKVLAVPQNK